MNTQTSDTVVLTGTSLLALIVQINASKARR
jgi:hypothetical protein